MPAHAHIPDDELLQHLKAGDMRAFEHIYRRYAPELFHVCFKVLRDQAACEDLVQELFMRLWTKRHHLPVQALKPYLYRAARNNVLKAVRSNRIRVDVEHLEALVSQVSSSDRLRVRELQLRLNQGLDKLPEKCRIIFEMSRFQQLSHKEIAARLNISVKTVENQIGIALKRLRMLLRDFVYLLLLYLWY